MEIRAHVLKLICRIPRNAFHQNTNLVVEIWLWYDHGALQYIYHVDENKASEYTSYLFISVTNIQIA